VVTGVAGRYKKFTHYGYKLAKWDASLLTKTHSKPTLGKAHWLW